MELGFDLVEPARIERHMGEFDVGGGGPVPDPGVFVR
jgi:hypothetical protein